MFEVEGDTTQLGADFSYTVHPKGWAGVLSANLFLMDGRHQSTEAGSVNVTLNQPPGIAPFYLQQGGGVEYSYPATKDVRLAWALDYRQTTVHSGFFTARVPSVDSLGQPLTLSAFSLSIKARARSSPTCRRAPSWGTRLGTTPTTWVG